MAFNSPRSPWKGKCKAIESDSDFPDLNPVLTYRHLHSSALGTRDPLRVIALIDNDAFYAACEMIRLGIPDKPLVVLQWESLIAVNYPARKFGISRMDNIKEAKKRCPELVVVHVATYKEGEKEPGYWDNVDPRTHKVSLDYYRRESVKVLNLFKDGFVGAEIEKASIDEAFIDLTKPVKDLLLQRYPHLAEIPASGPDSPLPAVPDGPWNVPGNIVPVDADVEEDDPCELPCTDASSWHDVALFLGAELVNQVRQNIKTVLGYSTSAGISRNKFLAKLVASYRKLDTQTILRNAAIPGYLKPLAFQKIRFLGGKLGDAIAKEYNVSKVGELLPVSLEQIQDRFGEEAIWVYDVIRGIDRSEVKEKPPVQKSMLASKNLPTHIVKASEGYHWIRVLAAELALRLNQARESSPNLWPKTLVIHARKGYETSRSRQAPFPFNRHITVDLVAAAGDKLWNELMAEHKGPIKISNVSLAFTGVGTSESGQQSIAEFFNNNNNLRTLKRPFSEEDSEEMEIETASHSTWVTEGVRNGGEVMGYTCKLCGKSLDVPAPAGMEDELTGTILRQEHTDWHMAKDLAAEQPRISITSTSKPKVRLEPKKKRKKGGIEAFFKPVER